MSMTPAYRQSYLNSLTNNKHLKETHVEKEVSSVYKKTEDEEKTPSTESPTRPEDEKALYEKDGFLAGEKTPVWKTGFYYDHHRRVKYTVERVRPSGLPMVKRAMNFWKSLKNRSGFPVRRISRSADDRGNLTSTEHFYDVLRNARINGYDAPSLVGKQSTGSNRVIYPSVLVVMDYHNVFPTDDFEKSWSFEHLILYALAFWGTVDNTLRNIQNPRVSLTIAGIIISTVNTLNLATGCSIERRSVPYMTEAHHLNVYSKGVPSMMKYWRSVSKRSNSDIPIGSYDIIAHMTDILPWHSADTWVAFVQQDTSLLCKNIAYVYKNIIEKTAGMKGPPCKLTDQIGGVILYDDLSFHGIHWAIEQMINVLGGSGKVPRAQYGFPRITWTKEVLKTLSNSLKNTSCMSAPKHYHRPGTPVPPILAGELMPLGKQCELYGYAANAWTCWDSSEAFRHSDCLVLFCSNQNIFDPRCSEVAATLDGSFCNAENTKICLDGKCVDMK